MFVEVIEFEIYHNASCGWMKGSAHVCTYTFPWQTLFAFVSGAE